MLSTVPGQTWRSKIWMEVGWNGCDGSQRLKGHWGEFWARFKDVKKSVV